MELYFGVVSKQSPLTERHRSHGAEWIEENGWLLPGHFGDPAEEYRAVRERVGLLDLCHRSLVRLLGPDRVSFLQGMVSNDVKPLLPGQGLYAAILDVSGKILADVRILCADESFVLDLWESLREKILHHLHRYLVADEVEIIDLTGEFGILSVQGPKTRLLLHEICAGQEFPSRPYSHRTMRIGDAEVGITCATHTGEEGFDLFIETKDLSSVASRLEEAGETLSLRWVGTQALETLRIEAGIPLYGVDMDEGNLLLETGLDHAVSFHKGCYLGQEVVERIRSRGHVNRRLVGLVLEREKAARAGDKILAGDKEVGRVTSSVVSPAVKKPIAFGYVSRDHCRDGTRLAIRSTAETFPAVISTLPFYKTTASLEST